MSTTYDVVATRERRWWIGWEDAHLTPAQEQKTVLMHDAWNDMLCRSAKSHGFVCADIYHAFSGASGLCGHGERAIGAASLLTRAGFTQLTVLAGSPQDWADANGEALVTGS